MGSLPGLESFDEAVLAVDPQSGQVGLGRDTGSNPMAEPGQVEAAFAGADDAYRRQGLVGNWPELRAVDPLTPNLTLVDVGWTYPDGAGEARQHSSYRFQLRRAPAPGQLGIQVVVDTTSSWDREGSVAGGGLASRLWDLAGT